MKFKFNSNFSNQVRILKMNLVSLTYNVSFFKNSTEHPNILAFLLQTVD